MSKLIIHNSPREFLNANFNYLEQNELENNLIIGVCMELEQKGIVKKEHSFLSVKDNGSIEALSVKTSPRVYIAGDAEKDEAIKLLAEFYKDPKIKTGGVMGEKSISDKFAGAVALKQKKKRILILHELLKINGLPFSKGKFEQAKSDDLDLLIEYRLAFDKETFGYSRMDYDESRLHMKNQIENKSLFTWVYGNEIVSLASIMRVTKNIGIIGIVYTPEKFRGKGYATSIVMSLSNEIFNRGFSKCGLYTDKLNTVSADIYYKIGYRPAAEYADTYFAVSS